MKHGHWQYFPSRRITSALSDVKLSLSRTPILCSCDHGFTAVPKTFVHFATMADEKQIKAAIKEGGKKGVDLQGMCDMGGVKHFNVAVDSPDGSIELIKYVLQGANKEVEEGSEERKGGAGAIGKCFYSAGKDVVAIACHVPKELAEEKGLSCKEWFDTVTAAMGGEVEISEESEEIIIAVSKGSKEKELFPLKMRDAGSSAGYQMLLKKGLIPQDDSDDDFVADPEALGIDPW
eukprot:jgi/Ulvmu1/9535/UM053_0024.1